MAEKTVCIDLDDTCVHYNRAFFSLLEKDNIISPNRQPQTSYYYNNNGWETSVDDIGAFVAEYAQKGIYSQLAIYNECQETIKWLKQEGWRIVILTSRLFKKPYSRIVQDTCYNLDAHGIEYDDIILLGSGANKSDIIADLYIDDSPVVLKDLQEHNRNYVIFDQPYNKDIKGNRIKKWSELPLLLKKEKING